MDVFVRKALAEKQEAKELRRQAYLSDRERDRVTPRAVDVNSDDDDTSGSSSSNNNDDDNDDDSVIDSDDVNIDNKDDDDDDDDSDDDDNDDNNVVAVEEEKPVADEKPHYDNDQALHWVFRRASFIGRLYNAVQKRASFKFFAAACMHLDEEQVTPLLVPMLHPLYRAREAMREKRREGLRTNEADEAGVGALANEVIALLQRRVDALAFADAYNAVRNSVKARRDVRKRSRAVEAVANPALAARRKQAQYRRKRARIKESYQKFK